MNESETCRKNLLYFNTNDHELNTNYHKYFSIHELPRIERELP